MKFVLPVCLALGMSCAVAQNNPAPSGQASRFAVTGASQLARCEQPAMLACLEMDQATCKTAVTSAIAKANKEIAEEVAKEPITPAREGYLKGFGMGRLAGSVNVALNKKFFACAMKK